MTLGSNEREIEVRDPVGAAVGDVVSIGILPANVVWASTVAYIFPVLAMLGGALIGMRVAPEGTGDASAAIGAFTALALAFGMLYIYDRVRADRVEKMPVVLSVQTGSGAECSEDGDVDVDRSSDVE